MNRGTGTPSGQKEIVRFRKVSGNDGIQFQWHHEGTGELVLIEEGMCNLP